MPPRSHVVASLALLGILAVGASAASAQTSEMDDVRRELRELEAERREAERAVEAARQQAASLDQSLGSAAEELLRKQADELEAEDEAAQAGELARRAEAELRATEAELQENERRTAEFVAYAYKHGPASVSTSVRTLQILTSSSGPRDLADSLHFVQREMLERQRTVEEAAALRVTAEALAARARDNVETQQQRLADAEVAREDAAAAHARLTQLAADADSAVAAERQRLTQTTGRQQATQQQLRELEQELERERARARQARAGAGLVTVGGITVASELGPSLQALLDAARQDGIVLGGSGYRSADAQAALRRANGCPDVNASPASSCRIPTARPGESAHEQGLAIDFTYQGRTICYPSSASNCRGNRAFDWLRSNASRFGLRVLASEAWHWSTNGG